MPLRAKSWKTSKGTLVLDDQVVSFTIGRKTETMGVADMEPFDSRPRRRSLETSRT
jgi:hypothetical protein